VLVTGAGGFIGTHLVHAQLALGRQVTAVDVSATGLHELKDTAGLRIVEADVCATTEMAELMQDADVVFHLAAAHLELGADDAHYRAVNVEALRGLLRSASAAGIQRFVHCSTVGVYGPLARLPADETTPCNPDIAYERTKLQGEEAVRDFAVSGGISTVILRPSWVYGPGCPRTAKLIRSIARKRFFLVGDGRNLRHPLYVDDLLRAFELAATRQTENADTFVIAGPEAVSVRDLVEAVMRALRFEYRPIRLPQSLVAASCLVLEKSCVAFNRQPPFSSRSLKFFTESSAFSTRKAAETLGFQPQTDLDSGLASTLASCRQQGLL
jgi:nucleoside-diphosphate-sugar epimerase